MDRALEQYEVVGLPTNIEFLRRAVKHPAFVEGGVDTGFLEVRHPQRQRGMAGVAVVVLLFCSPGELMFVWCVVVLSYCVWCGDPFAEAQGRCKPAD